MHDVDETESFIEKSGQRVCDPFILPGLAFFTSDEIPIREGPLFVKAGRRFVRLFWLDRMGYLGGKPLGRR